ncbi:MAG: hypothetical protein AB7G28_07645 [Pirellulales bacterium]
MVRDSAARLHELLSPILNARIMTTVSRSVRRPSLAAAACATLSLVLGCGPSSDRLAVSGAVTLDGAPLNVGSIRFDSAAGQQKVVSSGALVRDGEYYVPQDKGLPPGKYRVQITSPDENAPPVMMPATASGPAYPVAPDRIPPEYNLKSNVTVEVTADGDNQFDFAVPAKKK